MKKDDEEEVIKVMPLKIVTMSHSIIPKIKLKGGPMSTMKRRFSVA